MPSRSLRKLFSTRSNHHRDASYVFCPYYPSYVWGDGLDEGDENHFPHIYISQILGSVLVLLDSTSQTPLFICKGFTLIRSQRALSLRWVRHQHDDGQLHDGVGERGDDFIRPSIAQALGVWGMFSEADSNFQIRKLRA